MNRHIASLQIYVHKYEQSAISPLQFLLSIKAARLLQIHINNSQLSMIESLNKKTAMESLSEFQITERGNRCIENDCLLKLMSTPELLYFLILKIIDGCYHISCVTSDRVWISDNRNSLILTNSAVDILHRVEDSCKKI